MTTREETFEVITLLSSLPNNPITSYDIETPHGKKALEIFVNAYHKILEDVPIEYVQAAALQYLNGDNKFFPSNPGTLREIAFDLEMMARDIPTPSTAWAMVLSAKQKSSIRRCETANEIFSAISKIEQPGVICTEAVSDAIRTLHKKYFDHSEKCPTCKTSDSTVLEYEYEHEAVSRVVYLMGGRDVIFTENLAADRARFMDSYRELVTMERRKLQMHPQVANLIADSARPRIGIAAQEMKLLTAKMEGK